ncbi:MAG: nucleotidyltransferase domain-containing protein [Candidatus Aminicenantes bacterium]|nr:nucleotidyltransferase domain-containing protein [Candidatus Aminicenantes bacterium]NIM78495.1 nucleotidyltransferase domain-containing protein [Candidatus Aminicenantes bacterium]NIN19916.1 nucleotidyltransferase domain-containing protein [Candidatus Aminicenantes bacterium]NIN41633.1 nucleotidyltransferase domain-containing protein [Candidatus Aminicenantes bacterium]NIN86542.1 nucleotidyltransferase domain-containing protein [Candidatus Aminicenantes bacterium]
MEQNSELVNRLREYFLNRGDVAFAFLYGSYARGTPHKHSDVDVAVYFYPGERYPVPYEEEIYYDGEDEIWAELDQMLGKEVELLVLNRAAAVVCASATRGIQLAVKDWNLYFDYVEAISRDAEDFMQMRKRDFLERCGA